MALLEVADLTVEFPTRRGVLRESRLLAPVVAAVASAAAVVAFVLIGVMVGQSQLSDLGPRSSRQTARLPNREGGHLGLSDCSIEWMKSRNLFICFTARMELPMVAQ